MQNEVNEVLDLGVVLGQNQAFGLIAGRCSAAQAESIRRIRTEQLYKRVTEHWRDFCPQYLKMSGSQADNIIRLWEEFGAGYFEVAQLTRVSPETYRAIEPAVENGVLNLNGEQIELTLENSRRVAAAVAEVRRTLPAKPVAELSFSERVARLDRLCQELTQEFTAIPDISAEAFQTYRISLLNLYTVLHKMRAQFRY
uniref:Uncharacterized protein n=1 Tax=Solibacter usitatus (strain Ellin6076) TaxID=234267 RepID=Q01XC5_SOLUE